MGKIVWALFKRTHLKDWQQFMIPFHPAVQATFFQMAGNSLMIVQPQ